MKNGVSVSEFDQKKSTFGKGATPPSGALQRAGREMKENPPAILAKTARKSGKKRAKKQKVAILLSKARNGG